MASAVAAGIGVGAAAYAGKLAMEAFTRFRSGPARLRQFYKGGFQPSMTRREASLILGVRESAPEERVKEAHLRIMKANHPDLGGSSYLAEKVNEAKAMLLGTHSRRSSAF